MKCDTRCSFVAFLLSGHDVVSAFQQKRQGSQNKPANSSFLRRQGEWKHDFPHGISRFGVSGRKMQRQMSAIPAKLPHLRRVFRWPSNFSALDSKKDVVGIATRTQLPPGTVCPSGRQAQEPVNVEVSTRPGISKIDIALFVTYFANMFMVNLSVVTVPALAAATFIDPAASATFEASVASMAPMGGAVGKVINGFVCQRLGGRRASWIYLVGLSALSCGMSFTRSVGSIGTILMFYEFLSSVQWTSICLVLDDKHNCAPRSIARGVASLSLSSYTGALAAKTVGAALLNISGCWRSVTRVGSLVGMIGVFAMFFGISPPDAQPHIPVNHGGIDKSIGIRNVEVKNPLNVLKAIMTNKLFWMVGIGHSLGYVIRGSDRLLVPFLHQATGFPRHICASLTSFVTLGLVVGLGKGTEFSAMESIPEKMIMLRRNYIRAIGSFLGLGACALSVMNGWIQAPYLMAFVISGLSCLAASSISFQFSQVPVLVASNMFAENKAVALSLVDAGGFFFTSQIFAANTRILESFGWSASWTFLSIFLAIGASLMMKYLPNVLMRERQRVAIAI